MLSEERKRWLAQQVLPHEPALRAWLSSRRLPGLEIDDVIQETYCRLMLAENSEAIRNPKAYMFQTAWSLLITHVRRERVVPMRALADVNELAFEAGLPSPEQEVVDRDELRRLAEAIAVLPGRVGQVFRLHRVHGLSQKAVASRLGLSESTVEKHMRKGILLLLERFTRSGYPPRQASRMDDGDIKPDHGQGER